MSKPDAKIPLIDFSKYLHGTSEEKATCVSEIIKGFTTSGFLYLTNSGLSPATAFEWSKQYFALPKSVKEKHPNVIKEANRGYSGMGIEKVTNLDLDTKDEASIAKLRAAVPDLKESLEIGSDAGRYPAKPWQNHYPDTEVPEFGKVMRKFYESCDELHHEVLCAVAEGLGLDKNFFKQYVNAGDHVLRLLHYPAASKEVLTQPGTVRAGSHTDYGTITLLFQDMSGGLQIRTPEGEWQDVEPIEGAIVINSGDMLQIWTNDVIKSTNHRVVSPPSAPTTDDGSFSARYSIAYFAHPDHDRLVNTIETCFDEQRPKKYSPVYPGEWIVNRLTATY
ncbi:oxidoreductase [Mytilinidion resinicola]|uniref:Oxidoreductase n=1 Tax=Mytilinidion resinicola TaxID=574789 RepID=A0A6A6Y5G6_9PEZI|nr:oxidoreductase [Mytilinidion resinicola]KAF2804091.1 oxidoreductase [Mytilinidion resinicola]